MPPLFYRPNEFDDWGQIRNTAMVFVRLGIVKR